MNKYLLILCLFSGAALAYIVAHPPKCDCEVQKVRAVLEEEAKQTAEIKQAVEEALKHQQSGMDSGK